MAGSGMPFVTATRALSHTFTYLVGESIGMVHDVIASGGDAIRRVERGDQVTYKNEGQGRRKEPLEVVRVDERSSTSGNRRKELELRGNRSGCYLLSFSITDSDPFEDALHVNLNSANVFYPEEFYLHS